MSRRAGSARPVADEGHGGAATLIQRFGSRAGQKVPTVRGAERGHETLPADGRVPREGLAHAKRERSLQGMPREGAARQPLCAAIAVIDTDGAVHTPVGAIDRPICSGWPHWCRGRGCIS